MAMTDRDDMMIEKFFKQAAQQQIEDHGFTERVMQSLPERKLLTAHRLSQLWTLFCIVVALALFFLFGGWQALQSLFVGGLRMMLGWLEVLMVTAPTAEIPVPLNPMALVLLVAFVLIYLPYRIGHKLSAAL